MNPGLHRLHAFVTAFWLAACVLPGSPVLCIGTDGHSALEFNEPVCCESPGTPATPQIIGSDDDCVDCSDFPITREGTQVRRDASPSVDVLPVAVCAVMVERHSSRLGPVPSPDQAYLPHDVVASTVLRR